MTLWTTNFNSIPLDLAVPHSMFPIMVTVTTIHSVIQPRTEGQLSLFLLLHHIILLPFPIFQPLLLLSSALIIYQLDYSKSLINFWNQVLYTLNPPSMPSILLKIIFQQYRFNEVTQTLPPTSRPTRFKAFSGRWGGTRCPEVKGRMHRWGTRGGFMAPSTAVLPDHLPHILCTLHLTQQNF